MLFLKPLARPLLIANVLALLVLAAARFLHADDAVRCDGKLLGAGRSRIEVLHYCGEPQDRISYLDERTMHTRYSVFYQGTMQFTRSTGTYAETSRDVVTTTGTSKEGNDRAGREVVLPQTHQHDESRIVQSQQEQSYSSYASLSTYWECKKVSLWIDEYTYNFGTGKFMTYVRFENGRIKDIRYGEYGF